MKRTGPIVFFGFALEAILAVLLNAEGLDLDIGPSLTSVKEVEIIPSWRSALASSLRGILTSPRLVVFRPRGLAWT